MNSRQQRKPLPPPGERPWLLRSEAAIQIGSGPATIHRLRRGEIDGVPRLPAVRVGKRKWIVLKESLELGPSEAPTREARLDQSRRPLAFPFHLDKVRNSDLKIIADQQGYGMRTHLDVQNAVAERKAEAAKLYPDFTAVRRKQV